MLSYKLNKNPDYLSITLTVDVKLLLRPQQRSSQKCGCAKVYCQTNLHSDEIELNGRL